MRIYHKEINGQLIHSHNDSNIEWVVYSQNHSTQRFEMSKWSMKEAVKFYIELMRIK